MLMRCALLVAICLLSQNGCTPPNTPEPNPPPPMMEGEPVSQLSGEPALEAQTDEPAVVGSPIDSDRPTNVPLPPTQPVDIDEQIARLAQDADRQAAAEALASAGKTAVPALLKSLEHTDWQVRAAAVFALGQIGSEADEAKSQLQSLAEKDENSNVRDAAAFALDALENK